MNVDGPSIPPRFEDSKDRLVYLLAEYKVAVGIAGLAVLVLFASGRWNLPTLPDWVGLVLKGTAIGIVPAMVLSKVLIVDPFIPAPYVHVAVWDPDKKGHPVEINHKSVPRDLWSEREHQEGMPVLEPAGSRVDAIVTDYSYDDAIGKLVVRGVNPEIADPASLQATNGKLDEVFNTLLQDRKELDRLKATENLRQHKVEENTVNALVGAVEEGVAFEGASDVLDEEVFSDFSNEDGRTDAVDDTRPTEQDGPDASASSDHDPIATDGGGDGG